MPNGDYELRLPGGRDWFRVQLPNPGQDLKGKEEESTQEQKLLCPSKMTTLCHMAQCTGYGPQPHSDTILPTTL